MLTLVSRRLLKISHKRPVQVPKYHPRTEPLAGLPPSGLPCRPSPPCLAADLPRAPPPRRRPLATIEEDFRPSWPRPACDLFGLSSGRTASAATGSAARRAVLLRAHLPIDEPLPVPVPIASPPCVHCTALQALYHTARWPDRAAAAAVELLVARYSALLCSTPLPPVLAKHPSLSLLTPVLHCNLPHTSICVQNLAGRCQRRPQPPFARLSTC